VPPRIWLENVHPFDCSDQVLEHIPLALGARTVWRVNLDPGAYELQYFAYFEAGEGRNGDVSGASGSRSRRSPRRPSSRSPLDASVC
jgi:hypothetical protein